MTLWTGIRRPLALTLAGALALAPARAGASPAPADATGAASPSAAPLRSEAAAPFVLPVAADDWYHGLWSDGVVMIVADFFHVWVLCRGGGAMISPKLRGVKAVTGAGAGAGFVGAAVDEEGSVALLRDGRWSTSTAPLIEGDKPVALAVDPTGAVYVAGSTRALYIGRGEGWVVHRYPPAFNGAIEGSAWLDDGTLILVGDGVLALRGGAIRRSPLVPRPYDEGLKGAWMSPSGALWLLGPRVLRRIVPGRAQVEEHPVPLGGGMYGMSGAHTSAGDVIAVAGLDEVAIFDGETFERLDLSFSFPEGIFLDAAAERLYVSHRDGLRRVAFDHPKLTPTGAPPGATCPFEQDLGEYPELAARRREALAAPPEVATLTPVTINQITRRGSMPSLRLGLGGAIGELPDGRVGGGFALDLLLGGTIGVRPKLALWPELGYGYSRLEGAAGHLFLAGVGPLYGGKRAGIALIPRFAAGTVAGELGIGVRTSVVGTAVMDLFAVEVSHQWLRVGGEDRHEARVMGSINVMPLLGVVALALLFRGIFGKR